MNKYLKRYNELIDELAKEENDTGYSYLTCMLIAEELDCYMGGYYEDYKLTESQEECLIEIIYDYYIDTDDTNIFKATRGVVDTLMNYETFEDFYNGFFNSVEERCKIMEDFNWNSSY